MSCSRTHQHAAQHGNRTTDPSVNGPLTNWVTAAPVSPRSAPPSLRRHKCLWKFLWPSIQYYRPMLQQNWLNHYRAGRKLDDQHNHQEQECLCCCSPAGFPTAPAHCWLPVWSIRRSNTPDPCNQLGREGINGKPAVLRPSRTRIGNPRHCTLSKAKLQKRVESNS